MLRLRRRLLGTLLAAAGAAPLGAGAVPPLPAQPFATRMTASNVATLQVRGPDAHGGIGDWALGNGTLCAVVSDLAHESALSPQGGVLVDISHCGLADDHFVVFQPVMNFSRETLLPLESIRAETDEHSARVITTGSRGGIEYETTYSVSNDWPLEVRILTTISRTHPGERTFLFGDVTLHGHRQLSPFGIATFNPALSRGFAHPPIDVDSRRAMVRAMGSINLQVLVGSDAADPGVSYGLHLRGATLEHPDGRRELLPNLSLTGASFSLFGVFTRPLWIGGKGDPGLLEMAQTLWMNLREGDRIRYERAVLLGSRSDVASISDQIWWDAPRVRGRVDEPAARLFVTRSDGIPVTHVRPQPDGRFEFRVPVGRYRLRAVAPGGRTVTREFAVAEPEAGEPQLDSPNEGELAALVVELGELELGPPARIRLPSGHPMRLVFRGEAGTQAPRFGDDFRDFHIGSEFEPPSEYTSDVSLAGVAQDPRSVVVAPGRYRVYATRGLEYSVSEALVSARAGETSELKIQLPQRVLQSPGWLSADLHVHSGLSDDSTLDPRLRVVSFYAQGADVLVATEHDRIADLAPWIREMKLSSEIRSIVGVEITTTAHSQVTPYAAGHHNLFPVQERPHEYRSGAPAAEGRRLRTIIASARATGGERVFQLNHPRTPEGQAADRSDLNFFTHLSTAGTPFDPSLPLDSPANRPLSERDPVTQLRDLDFDVMELMNGAEMARYYTTRADWFSLLLQGEYRPATANSDSHDLRHVVALPRNYIRLDLDPAGELDEFDEAAFVRAVRRGELYATTGPLLDLKLGDVGIGGLFRGTRGTLHLRVDAAHWVPVSRARVYVNGALTQTFPISASERRGIVLSFEADSFVTVEVEGVADEIYGAIAPGFTPFAFSNPIFVDADGDGVWSAPGLPEKLPKSITDPLAALRR